MHYINYFLSQGQGPCLFLARKGNFSIYIYTFLIYIYEYIYILIYLSYIYIWVYIYSYTFLPHSYLGSLIVKLLLAHWKPNQGSDFFCWFQSHISKGQCNHDIECIRYRKACACSSLPHLLQPPCRYHSHLPSITQMLLLGRYRLRLKGLRQGDAWKKGHWQEMDLATLQMALCP